MPQHPLRMTTARAERLFHIAIADVPPPLSGDDERIEPPIVEAQTEAMEPLPLAAAPEPTQAPEPVSLPPTPGIAPTAPRPVRRGRTATPPVTVVPQEPPTVTRH